MKDHLGGLVGLEVDVGGAGLVSARKDGGQGAGGHLGGRGGEGGHLRLLAGRRGELLAHLGGKGDADEGASNGGNIQLEAL
ncbi:hypothetical protein D3C72_1818760 [compost metagenome]